MISMENCFLAFGVGNQQISLDYDLDMESPMSSEASTGYLQDAVVEWGERCKRRRMDSPFSFDHFPIMDDVEEVVQVFWDSNCDGNSYGDLESLFQESSIVSDENKLNFWDEKTEKIATKPPKKIIFTSPSTSQEIFSTNLHKKIQNLSTLKKMEEENEEKRMKRRKKKVAHPFTLVKPTGLVEGEATLTEINERLTMRPMRAVRHPVGEFKCRPYVDDVGGGPGLSGKAVVGLTRIHTQGRGTITIIRTRG